MKRSPTRRWLLISSLILLLLAGCGLWSRRVKLGEEFTMRPGEKVVVAGTDLTIQLDGVGHQSFPGTQPQPVRLAYVELTVTAGGAAPRSIRMDESADVGDYIIKLNGANPFRNNGGPKCELTVTRR